MAKKAKLLHHHLHHHATLEEKEKAAFRESGTKAHSRTPPARTNQGMRLKTGSFYQVYSVFLPMNNSRIHRRVRENQITNERLRIYMQLAQKVEVLQSTE